MELGWRPAGVALVAGRAVGTGADMVGALASRTAAVVAAGAGSSRAKGAVVGFGSTPGAIGLVAALAARRG